MSQLNGKWFCHMCGSYHLTRQQFENQQLFLARNCLMKDKKEDIFENEW